MNTELKLSAVSCALFSYIQARTRYCRISVSKFRFCCNLLHGGKSKRNDNFCLLQHHHRKRRCCAYNNMSPPLWTLSFGYRQLQHCGKFHTAAQFTESTEHEKRSVIWFLWSEGGTSESHERMAGPYGDSCISHIIIYEQVKRFREGRRSVSDHAQSGWPPTVIRGVVKELIY